VKSSRSGRIALAAALLATLGAKAVWTREAAAPDADFFNARAEALLRGQGYSVARDQRPFATLLFASHGGCRLLVAEYPPNGTLAEALTVNGRRIGPVHYIWRGETYATAPKLVPLLEFYLQRELQRIGFAPARQPILFVSAAQDCPAPAIDWSPLATLER